MDNMKGESTQQLPWRQMSKHGKDKNIRENHFVVVRSLSQGELGVAGTQMHEWTNEKTAKTRRGQEHPMNIINQ